MLMEADDEAASGSGDYFKRYFGLDAMR
jgi:hypothetical protein